MRKLNVTMLALIIILISAGSKVYGQYQGPGSSINTLTVKDVIDNATRLDRTDALVKMQGFVVKKINTDIYEFRDKTGTIRVEIDKKRMPAKPFDDKTELVLLGEVDKDILEPVEIEVKEVYLVSNK